MRNALILVLPVVTFASCSRMGEEELLQSAQNLYKEKKYQEAIEKYQELIDRFPEGKNAETSQFFIASICNAKPADIKSLRHLRKSFIHSSVFFVPSAAENPVKAISLAFSNCLILFCSFALISRKPA